LLGSLDGDVEFIFGDSIVGLDDRGDAVAVSFERADARDFDVVIGADGLHSNVRRLTFGPEEHFIKPLGTYLAIFTVPNFLHLDYWPMFHQSDSTVAGVYSARNNSEARAMLGFMDSGLRIDYRDIQTQFAELDRRMSDDGWVRPQLLEYMRTAPDFYFDGLAQIIIAGRRAEWGWSATPRTAARPCQGRAPASHCSAPTSWRGSCRPPAAIMNVASPTMTPRSVDMWNAPRGWLTTSRSMPGRSRRTSSTAWCTRSSPRITNRERSAGEWR
jgi:2-polyprenyl-6-methoxyphenol hydroxylase-like FAD-dependent oxidoreductase